ncbi:MAG TPA: PIG-L family deacetylase [Acidimicrobiales bacterium]|nr:PIG-L family deacetylase [Acidimicrobiales bacterium]
MLPAERGAVVFLHAHPDDEAIFTGGTMVRLAAAGWRVVLVVATGGELGLPVLAAGDASVALGDRRKAETRAAAAALGVARVDFLGYRDSGMAGSDTNTDPGCFAVADARIVGAVVAATIAEEGAETLVIYDEHGIYGHPDHIQVHQVGLAAAELAGVAVTYKATVDREYLHFVETHLVVEAGGHAGALGLAATDLGTPTVAVSTVVDVREVLETKRRAMTAHASQMPETTSAMRLPTEAFAAVYGYEWFVRDGPPGPLDDLH